MTWPALGTDTSSEPPGVHTSSRGFGTRAHTDNVHPLGTRAFRGSSNGAAARSSGTCTVTSTMPNCEAVVLDVLDVLDGADGVGGASDEHPASSSTPTRPADEYLRRGETRMHLPDQDLRGFGRGDPLPSGCREPNGVALVQGPGTFEGHFAARHEQM